MKIKIIIFFCIAFAISFYRLNAQDIHFSQFLASPLTLNPAKTGDYDGNWRFMNNFRRQWGSFVSPPIPYTTISVGIDKPFEIKRDILALGLIVINDESSDSKFTSNKIFGSIAYHKKNNKSYLRFGLQGGYVIKNYLQNQLTFPNQFDNTTGYFNSAIGNNETNLGEQSSYMDLNGGVEWTRLGNKFQPEIGISFFHFISPDESFSGQPNKLPVRQVIYGKGKYLLSKKIFVQPSFLLMNQANASDALIGSHFGYNITTESPLLKTIFTGIYFRDGVKRNPDSFIMLIGANIKNFEIGFSYDINVSELKSATNYRGGFEISIIYIAPKLRLNQISIPCDRF